MQLQLPQSISTVPVDRRRIEQAVTNILSNAIRYTPKQGNILIRISDTPRHLQVCMTDDGPGIPEEHQGHIFEKFYVVGSRQTRSGLGLGLYIAREMIELHSGSIWVESQVGKGSTFCFQLPKAMEEGHS